MKLDTDINRDLATMLLETENHLREAISAQEVAEATLYIWQKGTEDHARRTDRVRTLTATVKCLRRDYAQIILSAYALGLDKEGRIIWN